ncbi:amino-acid permease BAT1 homolog isoform X1 [Oryza glaberrima]|uniref:amino-acid permease BAT1 homolog isoform X1 n=1 Tax=Oryza glaberrima TaxID=4538 RepID=UPI00224C505B|nr:amino-acid permease BAT1 homolog isoform X1 [Oryza glaberrima]
MALSRSVEVAVPADPAGDGDRDKIRLRQLGYKQELKRGLSVLSNFAFSFSIISVMAGVTTTYSTGLRYGGPVSMTLGWLVVSAFNGCMALSMAEICSAYPTSGGLYYWSAKLAGNDWAPFASWITGWFNITGQWAATTSVDFALAQLVQVIVLLSTGGANGGGYMASNYVVLAIYGAMLVIHGAINSLPIQCLSWFGQLGAFWNAAGVFVLVALIPAVATERASVEFIFTHFNTENGMGIRDKAYILLIGLLMSQYAMAGYDTSAHMTEETKNADWSGPIGIVTSVALSTVFGWIYIVSLTSAVTDIPYLLSPDNDAGGNAVAQAFYTTFHRRYGSGLGGILCLGVVVVAVFLCGLACITSNSSHCMQDGVCVLQGRSNAVLESLAPSEQARGAYKRRIALCGGGVHHGSDIAGKPGGIPSNGVHRDDRALHLLRAADLLPGDDGEGILRSGAVSPWQVRDRRRLGRRALGGRRHRALLAAGGVPGGGGDVQLHAGGRRRRAAAHRRRVGAPCPLLVPRAHY